MFRPLFILPFLALGLTACTNGRGADSLAAINAVADRAMIACRLADGTEVRTTVDDIAADLGHADRLDKIRSFRRLGCLLLGGVAVVTAATEATP